MEETVNSWIQACPRCTLHKSKPQGKAPPIPIIPKVPMHIIDIDFLTFGRPTDRYQNILVMTDLFSKFAWAVPTMDQTALTTARAMRLPADMLAGTTGSAVPSATVDWVSRHQEQLCYAYNKASASLQKAAEKNKRLYVRTAKEVPLLPGERVLVLNQRRTRDKLSDRWEDRPSHIITSRLHPELPIYKIRPEGKDGPERTLHRNLLRPCLQYPPQETIETENGGTSNTLFPGWGLLVPMHGGEDYEQDPSPELRRSQRATRGVRPQRYRENVE